MKKSFYVSPSISTPEISYEPEKKSLNIIGQSYPADSIEFYRPFFEWIVRFLAEGDSSDFLTVVFRLKYYNTSSSKQFVRFFSILEESKIAAGIKIEWIYQEDDNEMYEAGIRFSMFSNLKFEVKSYQSE
jgi:hypothetical protein